MGELDNSNSIKFFIMARIAIKIILSKITKTALMIIMSIMVTMLVRKCSSII